jgi:hypothetical protein
VSIAGDDELVVSLPRHCHMSEFGSIFCAEESLGRIAAHRFGTMSTTRSWEADLR